MMMSQAHPDLIPTGSRVSGPGYGYALWRTADRSVYAVQLSLSHVDALGLSSAPTTSLVLRFTSYNDAEDCGQAFCAEVQREQSAHLID